MEKKEPKIKILVACHKADPAIRQDDIYMPIHVGKALHPELDLGFQGDDTGDNISEKNGSYCELTAMYWAWKNLPKDVDIVGLCHYRRYFDFKSSMEICVYSDLASFRTNLDKNIICNLLRFNQLIVPKQSVLPMSVFAHYAYYHCSEDFRELEHVIGELYPEYICSFKDVVYGSNKFSQYNMFITTADIFRNYCTWLFSILERLEKRLNIENYGFVQKRVYGYLAERLFNVYIHYNRFLLAKTSVAFIDDGMQINRLKLKLAHFRDNLAFSISRIHLR